MSANYWTDERIIYALRIWAMRHGRTPTCRDWDRATPEHPAAANVRQKIGWNHAIRAAKLTPNLSGPIPGWTRESAIDAMLDWVLANGRWPNQDEVPASELPSRRTANRLFGSWRQYKRAAGQLRTCGHCSEPIEGPSHKKWCSNRCRQRGLRVVVAASCVGCGGEMDGYTVGCKPCWTRRDKRRKREQLDVRLRESAQRAVRRAA